MKQLLLIILLLIGTLSFSQEKEHSISGVIFSKLENVPLESATIFIEKENGSSLISYTISDNRGKFLLEGNTSQKKLRLNASYVGYNLFTKTIHLDKANIVLDTMFLTPSNTLNEVIINARVPVTIKKDTLEFNVKSFKTKKGASVEDLLKKLPGIEVDDNGSITVNGKSVNKVLVNGKPFFGNDPTIATRNLTKEIIEKVQVTNSKTKDEAFTGEKGSDDNKTINLTIKEENNKGVFGRLSAGLGTDKRFEHAGFVNRFNNNRRLSFLAGGNNINASGFSFGEINKMFGNANSVSFSSSGNILSVNGRNFGGGQGISKSKNYGANYVDQLTKNIDFNADYFNSGSTSKNESIRRRESFLPDTRFYTNSNSNTINTTDNHQINLAFEIKLDSTLLINVDQGFQFSSNKTNYTGNSESLDEFLELTNNFNSNSYTNQKGRNFDSDISITKKLGKHGISLKYILATGIRELDKDDFIFSETNIYGNTPSSLIRDQFTNEESNSNQVSHTISSRLPLVKDKWFFTLSYNFSKNEDNNLRSTYDFDNATQDYTQFNLDLSTDYTYTNRLHKPSAVISFSNDKTYFGLTTEYNIRTLQNKDALRPLLNLEETFKNIGFRAYYNYSFNAKERISLGYRLLNSPPRLNQIQPFQDISNPLNIIQGNPNLKPSQTNSFDVSYSSFDFQKKSNLSIYAYAHFEKDRVIRQSVVNSDLIVQTTYTNVSGNYSVYANARYSKTIALDSLSSIRLSLSKNVSIRKNINFFNGVKYKNRTTNFRPSLGIKYTLKNVFEIEPKYEVSFNNSRYDIEDLASQNFDSHGFKLKTACFLPKHFEWRNELVYSYNPKISTGFNSSVWFWNTTLTYSFLKDKALLTLKVFDVLGQNNNSRTITTANYIQDQQNTVLQRYAMLSFSWKFNTLGKKGETGNNTFFF